MSEQNQMAISPITAGLVGAGIGATNYWVGIGAKPAEGYRNTKELLTLDKDKFEALAKKINESDNAEAKAEFQKLADGRVTVSEAGDTLIKEQAQAKKGLVDTIKNSGKAKATEELNALNETNTKVEELRKKMDAKDAAADADVKTKRAELKTARDTARKAITDKVDDGLGKELKEAQDELAKATTDEAKQAAQAKIDTVNNKISKEVTENADVKKAKEALNEARKNVITEDTVKPFTERNAKADAYRNKLVEELENLDEYKNATANKDGSAIEKLKHSVEEHKAKLAEKLDDVKGKAADELVGEKGALKDFDMSKIGKYLEKTKTKATLIGAAVLGAAGVALSYIVGPKNPTPKDVA